MALETEGRNLDLERLRLGTLAVFESTARGFYLVAELHEEKPPAIIGQLLVTNEWSDWRNATFWWIQSVYVQPSWRRQGVYRRMHETAVRMARELREVCGVRLYVEKNNHIAQTVYERVGLTYSAYHMFEEDFVFPKSDRH